MKMKTKYVLSMLVLISLLFAAGGASARPLNAALSTGFTYQGKLTDGGSPANGTYDFEFKLFDALSAGNPVGSTVTKLGETVTAGLFTVQLDFGDVFNGTALYLDIGVRPGASVDPYTPLTPRQALTAAPYAIFASKAPWSGITGIPAGFADGVDDGSTYTAGTGLSLVGTQFNVTGAPWSGLTGVPASFADGVDDNTTYTAGDGLELVGTQFKGKGTSYQNVVIVAKSGGDFTTITAALTSILDAGPTNHYLIYVAPGVYTEQVTMKPYVDIEGAGELTTKITYIGNASPLTGTVVGANNAELRFLTVENTGSGDYAIAIYNSSAAPRLTHVTASASGGTNNFGVFNDSSAPTMMNVTASASGGTSINTGVYNYSSSPTMMNVTASGSGGTSINIGVYNSTSSPTMMNVTASGSGGTNNYGVFNDSSSPTINNSAISTSSAIVLGINNYGIYNSASSGIYTVSVNNSQVTGSTNTIYNDPFFITYIGASQLSGGAVFGGGGTVTCAGVYDEAYAFFTGPACP